MSFFRAGSAANPVVAASSGSPATYGPPSAAPQVQQQHHEHWNRGGGGGSSSNANHNESMQADLTDLYADFDALSESMSRRPVAVSLPQTSTSSSAIEPTASRTPLSNGNNAVSGSDNGCTAFSIASSPYFPQDSAARGWQPSDPTSAARLASGGERGTANFSDNGSTPNYVRSPRYGVDEVPQNDHSAAAMVTVHDANSLLKVQGSSDGGRWPVDYHEVDNGSPSWPAVADSGSAWSQPPPPPPPPVTIAAPRSVAAADCDTYSQQPQPAPSPPVPPPALSPSPAIAKNSATTRFGSAKVKRVESLAHGDALFLV